MEVLQTNAGHLIFYRGSASASREGPTNSKSTAGVLDLVGGGVDTVTFLHEGGSLSVLLNV